MELVTENTGKTDFVIGEALASLFSHRATLPQNTCDGLRGQWSIGTGWRALRCRNRMATFASPGETDRVYINTAAACVIEDDKLKRRIHIAKSGSLSTVVWTPWNQKSQQMGDMGNLMAGVKWCLRGVQRMRLKM